MRASPRICIVLLLTLLAPGARAEEPSAGTGGVAAPPAPITAPPSVLEAVDATYPQAALEARVEASVVLSVLVAADGQVLDASVVEPAGQGFDEAAAEAVKRFRFTPALRDGVPVKARIKYRYTFQLPAEPAPEAAAVDDGGAPASEETPSVAAPSVEDTTPLNPSTASPSAPPDPGPIVIDAAGQRTTAQKLEGSAEAVKVVDLRRARQRTRDLGEVLASVEGVSLRRAGGLGSVMRLSLNGLTDQQIRFFFDGVPVEIAGFQGVGNVPVSLVDNIEIYRGVTPVRFGADALGGAVNLVPRKSYDTGFAASYQLGSFNTHRASAAARYRLEPLGLVLAASGALDSARNDYEITVDLADRTGRSTPTRIKKRHDEYLAYGGNVEIGVVDQPWAKRLLLRTFYNAYAKQLPHNQLTTVPFGEAAGAETLVGATLRYDEAVLPEILSLSAVLSGSRRTTDFHDTAKTQYGWFGERIGERTNPGELGREAHDLTVWQDGLYGQLQLEWVIFPEHVVRMASTARYIHRTGDERVVKLADGSDPLDVPADVGLLVTGAEYELNLFPMGAELEPGARSRDELSRTGRLQNVAFIKHYYFKATSEQVQVAALLKELTAERQFVGFGDTARLRIFDWLSAKAAYEYAVRMPSIDELVGDNILVRANVDLQPETSHNVNAGLKLEKRGLQVDLGAFTLPLGGFNVGVDGFYRETDNLIAPRGDGTGFVYQNLFHVRTIGVEGNGSWTSPGSWLILEGNATIQDSRNTSTEGEFAKYVGQRVPNRPWLFFNWGARVQWRDVLVHEDELSPFYSGRSIQGFFRNWEDVGNPDFKAKIPDQMVHSAGISYSMRWPARVGLTFEIDNFLNAQTFDFFGIQRPGLSMALKGTTEF